MTESTNSRPCWFVSTKNDEEQNAKFLNEGVWFNEQGDKYHQIQEMQPGDKIALKVNYARKKGLPFQSNGQHVGVMAILATGTVQENPRDGVSIRVNWDEGPFWREWFFFTYFYPVWRVDPTESWMAHALVDFAFNNKPQNIDQFRNAPFWRSRYGDERGFLWAPFYESLADSLLNFRNDRSRLVQGLRQIAGEVTGFTSLEDEMLAGTRIPLEDICPFTVMGSLNRKLTDANRTAIAFKLASFLGIEESVPTSFEGIPILNNQQSWFFGYGYRRKPDDIEKLWEVFEAALRLADNNEQSARAAFRATFDQATNIYLVKWNLTMGLYWARPYDFLPLDSRTRTYISDTFGISVTDETKGVCSAVEYLALMDKLNGLFQQADCPVHTFPELSLAAYQAPDISSKNKILKKEWKSLLLECIREMTAEQGRMDFYSRELINRYRVRFQEAYPDNLSLPATVGVQLDGLIEGGYIQKIGRGVYRLLDLTNLPVNDTQPEEPQLPPEPIIYRPSTYTLNSILEEGCFLERHELENILDRLREKKNLVLQGPPGTGKTWLAKKLAFALVGARDTEKVRAVQFHPSLSYEDFIRGWRPAGNGHLDLVNGPFMEIVETAKSNPQATYVLVIEEINRGNPAQILGEMLTLLEADKRNLESALELSYRIGDNERVYIPKNLYVIGTMNIADRSLALVDLALRRRFAFCDLEPRLGSRWKNWMTTKFGFSTQFLNSVAESLGKLNSEIADDKTLGPQFRIGHSFVTLPANAQKPEDPEQWFRRVVHTEIGPLLEEYWFDQPAKALEAKAQLLGSD